MLFNFKYRHYAKVMKIKRLSWGVLSIFALAAAGLAFSLKSYLNTGHIHGADHVVALPIVPIEEVYPHVIEPNMTLFVALRSQGVSPQTIQDIVTVAKPIHNLAQLQPGIRFQTTFDSSAEPELNGLHFRFSAIESLEIVKQNNTWSAKKITEQVDIKVISFSGIVTTSLWESALKADMDPNLISELADIFGWEIDLSREVRVNDRWRLTVEQKLVKGEPVGWGAILAAEYDNEGKPYQATLFRQNGEDVGYFAPDGSSLRKMFLKSPIRYGRITSKFSTRRFHPILKTNRPHLGVDYGAPIGTPVRSVGDGTVIFAQRSGGGGNVIKIRHNATYQTAYKHLHGFAKGIRSGARVQQGQVIGYVGSTGLSTGPHLHFEFYQSGRYIDPLRKSFPSAEPVPKAYLADFQTQAKSLLQALPAWDTLEASEPDLAIDKLKSVN
jgi:murein DD-endopeptidase MepM/ murein hydrolase activator NlpD